MTTNGKREFPSLMGRGVISTGIECPLCVASGNRTVGGNVPTLRRLAEGDDARLFCMGQHGYVTDAEIVFEAIRTQSSPPSTMPDSDIWHAEDELRRTGKIYRDEDGEWQTR